MKYLNRKILFYSPVLKALMWIYEVHQTWGLQDVIFLHQSLLVEFAAVPHVHGNRAKNGKKTFILFVFSLWQYLLFLRSSILGRICVYSNANLHCLDQATYRDQAACSFCGSTCSLFLLTPFILITSSCECIMQNTLT